MHKILFRFTLSFLLVFMALLNAEQLGENIQEASLGDYLVIAQDKTYTLLNIFDRSDETLIIEELTVPIKARERFKGSWKQWLAEDAPGYNSWVMYEIRLDDGTLQEYYSFSRGGWINMSPQENFLPTLLRLEFEKVPDKERRLIGGGGGEAHNERIWNPPVHREGQKVEGMKFDAWRATWPNDGGPLAGKGIEIYLPKERNKYPAYYPYWLEISNAVGRAHLRIIDTGTELKSNKRYFPRRPPEFIGEAREEGGNLVFHLKAPLYYKQFRLFASGVDRLLGQITELTFDQQPGSEKGVWVLSVPSNEMQKKLQLNASYFFLLHPSKDDTISAETRVPFRYCRVLKAK